MIKESHCRRPNCRACDEHAPHAHAVTARAVHFDPRWPAGVLLALLALVVLSPFTLLSPSARALLSDETRTLEAALDDETRMLEAALGQLRAASPLRDDSRSFDASSSIPRGPQAAPADLTTTPGVVLPATASGPGIIAPRWAKNLVVGLAQGISAKHLAVFGGSLRLCASNGPGETDVVLFVDEPVTPEPRLASLPPQLTMIPFHQIGNLDY